MKQLSAEVPLQVLSLDSNMTASPISLAPNPKPPTSDKQGYGSLASLYTAFSLDFARYCLEHLSSDGCRAICDPFSGMGTVGEAGRHLPVTLTLNDLNPFAAMSAIFRTATPVALMKAIERMRSFQLPELPTHEREAFTSAVSVKLGKTEPLSSLINARVTTETERASLDIHLLSLIRLATHKQLRGSNPTWTKRSTGMSIDAATFEAARNSVLQAASLYAGKLPQLHPNFSAASRCGDLFDLQIEDGSVDAILTSPPYPNRTDYIRHYLPATELLIGGDETIERNLRQSQIGTPLIREEHEDVELPESAAVFIDAVRRHGSYASERYYSKGYHYYFTDMRRAFARIRRWLRPNGQAIIVVQDAYYKEIRIPVGDLVSDVAAMEGLVLEARSDFPVRQTLSRLSAKARAHAPKRPAVESVLLLRRR